MAEMKITLTHEGKEYVGQKAKIERTVLGYEDHGIFTWYLEFAGPSWGILTGGYPIEYRGDASDATIIEPYKGDEAVGTAYGMDLIRQIVRTCGVDSWEAVKGKTVIALFEPGREHSGPVAGFTDLDARRVFIIQDHFEWARGEEMTTS